MEIKSSAGHQPPGAEEGKPAPGVEPRIVAAALGVVLLVLAALLSVWQAPRPDPFTPVRVLSLDWWQHPVETNAFLRLAAIDAPLDAVHAAADGRRIWAVGGAGVIVHSDDQGAHWRRQPIDFTALGGPGANPTAPSAPKKAAAARWFERALPAANAQEANAPVQRAGPPPSIDAGPDRPASKSADPPARMQAEEPAQASAAAGPAVPNVTGRALDEARAMLRKSGLATSVSSRVSSAAQPGTVIDQSPTPGSRVGPGSMVSLVVAAAQPPSIAPNAPAGASAAVDAQDLQLGTQGAGADRCAGIRDKAEQLACYEGTGGGAANKRATRPEKPSAKGGGAADPPRWSAPPELRAIAMSPDGRRGVAVGAQGAVLVTTDGGALWKASLAPTNAELHGVALNAEGSLFAVAGNSGVIVFDLDPTSARTVTPLGSPQATGETRAVWRQGKTWVAVARTGESHALTDGGAWTSGPRPAGEFLAHASLGEEHLVAVRRATTTRFLIRAADGAWSERGELPGASVIALVQPAAQRIVAIADDGRVFESSDGANRWAPAAASVPGARAAAAAAGKAWLVGLDGKVDLLGEDGSIVPKTRGASGRLTAVAFDASDRSARMLWVAAASGVVMRSRDGGATFEPVGRLPIQADSLAFETALRGRARGAVGEEFETDDGGASWSRRAAAPANASAAAQSPGAAAASPALASRATVLATARSADGARLAAVGAAGLLLLGDAQRGDLASPLAPYARSAAPWTYAAALVALALLALAALLPPRPKVHSASVADMLASDKPLERVTGSDPLKLGPLAAGLARFLRNDATEPPLTIAITGEWGSGKSSLMNLLAAELRSFGISVVNFNAWHHQKEEHLLASLLTAVKNQAPPRWYSLQGLEFRWHLGVARAKRAPVLSGLLFLVLGAVVYLALNPGPLQPFADLVRRVVEYLAEPSKGFDWDLSKIPEKLLGASAFATALASALAALRRLRAFGVDPAQLAATLAANFSLKDASAQASFRERFAREFREVTTAMRAGSRPRVLTIFIDDLDRCRPEAVLEVLEAVNFLVSSGDCYVVLGMARERVEACVGLAFEKVAVEMVHLSGVGTAGDDADEARRKRREYARQYLEKLINVEVPMPVATIDQAQAIVVDGTAIAARTKGRFERPAWLASVAGFWPLLVAAGLFAAGVIGAHWMVRSEGAPPLTAQTGAAPSARATEPPNAGPAAPAAGDAAASQPAAGGSGELRDAMIGSVEWIPLAVLGTIAAVALGVAWLRRVDPVVRDSSQFKLALKIWLPVVVVRQNTPRAIKRFVNRVRYLAMLRGEPAAGMPDPGPLLVMLAAIQHADPAHLRDVTAFADGKFRLAADLAAPVSGAVSEAMRRHAELLAPAIAPQRFSDERRWFEENATSARIA
ncbi:MAG: PASTA domain-containing protein [Ideonella sp.]|nr:PASTA domain-containing protein [Ideonella sp.]